MKTKKAAENPIRVSTESKGIGKKRRKKKNKNKKSLVQKVSASSDVAKAVVKAAATAIAPSSPRKNKKNKKRGGAGKPSDAGLSSNTEELRINKLEKKKSEKSSNRATTNGISSDVKDVHMENLAEQKPSGKSPLKASLNGVSSQNKNRQKKKNQVTSRVPTENKATDSTSDGQKPTSADKNKKRRDKLREARKAKAKTPESDRDREARTIFVGNVSTKTTRKGLSRFFSEYGKVEAVRLRCAAVPTPGTTKKEAVIKHKFHEKRTSLSAFVRFTERAMVEAALKANGAELDQKHLQVDHSQGTTRRNTKLAVFVGNLAFEAEEEALREHFAGCGEIASVRIVRDNKLASGKGFGYINFVAEDAVEMALQMDGQVFMHRQLRVQRCSKQGNKQAKPRLKTKGKKGLSFMKTKPTSAKNPKKQQSFSGRKVVETKKFKKMKAKAKFSKEDRKKKAIAHKLAAVKPKAVKS